MKRHDFDLILLESFRHETKRSFFEKKRKSFDCFPEEFANGLVRSYDGFKKFVLLCDSIKARTIENLSAVIHIKKEDLVKTKKKKNLFELLGLKKNKTQDSLYPFTVYEQYDSAGKSHYHFPEEAGVDHNYLKEFVDNMGKFNFQVYQCIGKEFNDFTDIEPNGLSDLIQGCKESMPEIIEEYISEFNKLCPKLMDKLWDDLKTYFLFINYNCEYSENPFLNDESLDEEQILNFEIIKESVDDFLCNYPQRLENFLDEFEATEMDYIYIKLKYLEDTLFDIQNDKAEASSIRNIESFDFAKDLISDIGIEKFIDLIKTKIDFLANQKKSSCAQLTLDLDLFYESEYVAIPHKNKIQTTKPQDISKLETSFQNYLIHDKPGDLPEIDKIELLTLKTNVFCEKMPLDKPIEHFKIFTVRKSTNGEPFLTNDQYNSFIGRAFLGNQNISKQIFNRGDFKIYIQSIFYDFYAKYNNYFPSSQCSDTFINLLIDNFEGWDFKNVKINFAKKPKRMPK